MLTRMRLPSDAADRDARSAACPAAACADRRGERGAVPADADAAEAVRAEQRVPCGVCGWGVRTAGL